jgi:hypothetical protein
MKCEHNSELVQNNTLIFLRESGAKVKGVPKGNSSSFVSPNGTFLD